ncbi:MAG: aminopeptidase P family N-terminal domain-containing protein, partial [Gemmataceae bacterium]|nr:aminopeptidase P family N-terminal domain-containing protein [Gemmataceae bacterium]
MNYLIQRREALAQTAKTHGLDGFLVTADPNVVYLSGFTGGDSFFALLPKNDLLISDTRYEAQVKEECPSLDAVIRGHNKTTWEAAAEALTKAGVKSVGVEGN